MSKKVLGRGLGAFFPEYESGEQKAGSEDSKKSRVAVSVDTGRPVDTILEIPLVHIRANPDQPRKEFDADRLEELAGSIRRHGLIQPVTVRYLGEKRFELISGERRLRAGKLAGLRTIPAYIRDVEDEELLALALIENIQREDLNPLEVALGYRRLMEESGYTQAEVAEQVGKSRATVTNMLRLLNLPDFLQAALRDEQITTGHARAILNIRNPSDQKKLLERIVGEGLSVRDVELLAGDLEKKNLQKRTKSEVKGEDPFLNEISRRLRRILSTRVDLKAKHKGGEIRISYYSDDDLERILQLFENLD